MSFEQLRETIDSCVSAMEILDKNQKELRAQLKEEQEFNEQLERRMNDMRMEPNGGGLIRTLDKRAAFEASVRSFYPEQAAERLAESIDLEEYSAGFRTYLRGGPN